METTITVYALAWGGKFIGQGQSGEAFLTVTDPLGNVVAGVSHQPITQGGEADGSGVTSDIMISTMWGTAVNQSQAFSYTFSFLPHAPVQLTFTVEVYHYGEWKATASNQHMVWPGLTLAGPTAVQVIVPGLLTNVVVPPQGLRFVDLRTNAISANVYMMCGCMIDNDYWPGANFLVQAVLTESNGNASTVQLSWSGLATFSGNWAPTVLGPVTVQIFVVETTNGNTACSVPVIGRVVPSL